MNLIDIITRKDKHLLKVGSDLKVEHFEWLGERWRGVLIPYSQTPQLVIENLGSHYAMKSLPEDVGWYVATTKNTNDAILDITVEYGGDLKQISIPISSTPIPLILPWPDKTSGMTDSSRLELHFKVPLGMDAKLLVHQRLSRERLIKHAQGVGVEIGPGPNPQIHPSDRVSVEYIEESPAEKWAQAYDVAGKYGARGADFSRYTIGTAWRLPQADNSLDFIFSSHVFEHLANPIGHLMRWKTKLRKGGKILAVVPDMNGTKDYIATPSTIDEILKEYAEQLESPDRRHYLRWASYRNQLSKVDELISQGVSIHVHYYTPHSMALLLEKCIKDFGFNSFSIIHRRNHKDFYFIID